VLMFTSMYTSLVFAAGAETERRNTELVLVVGGGDLEAYRVKITEQKVPKKWA
jgi:hypothetical protein